MPRKSHFTVALSKDERRHLESMARQYTSPYCDVVRAKIILLAAEGLSNDVIASRLDTPRQIVSKWRKRFCLARLPGRAFPCEDGVERLLQTYMDFYTRGNCYRYGGHFWNAVKASINALTDKVGSSEGKMGSIWNNIIKI